MQWDDSISSSDIGGILKRKNPKIENTNNHKELLIFGYEAKVFRDDSKALMIDQGKHLLEWNGEKIDRYDVRATLLDSSQFDPPPGGYGNRLDCLPADELRAEQLAEEERYYALKHNEEEELMYQEEELKRLLHEKVSTYGQVQFDYNSESTTIIKSENDKNDDPAKVEEPEKPYVQPKNFNIPYSVLLPDTMNEHIIIEKTARFISSQGPQMEILIKAKQSNNQKFEFLNQNNKLNPYYKFLLNSIKNGTYPEKEVFEEEEISTDNGINSNYNLENMIGYQNTTIGSSISFDEPIIPNVVYKPSPNCAYTQLISKIKGVPIPEVMSQTTTSNTLVETNNTSERKNVPNENQKIVPASNCVEIKKISTGLMLAQAYASDSEDETDNCDNSCNESNTEINSNFAIPPESIQTVIDKTATYVKKNGKQFEETLRMKGDKRFLFLKENNEYYPYYMYKINGLAPDGSSQTKKKQITPVSFSIKPKEDATVQIKPALPQEGSDDEFILQKDNNQSELNNTNNNQYNQPNNSTAALPEHVKRAIQLVENQLVARTVNANNIQALFSKSNVSNTGGGGGNNKTKFDLSQNLQNKPTTTILTATAPIQNYNQKSMIERQKELKLAEEKVKDKLAQIAREKLGLISKEKQLQLERKKKAIAFLNHIKDSTGSSNLMKSKDNDTNNQNNNSDNESVHSIPISSYGGNDDDINTEQICSISSPPPPPSELTFLTCRSKSYTGNDNDINSNSSIDSDNSRSRSKNKFTYSSTSRTKSRSRTRSKSHKRKKSKHYHHHSKKKSRKRSRSRSDRTRSRSISPSFDQRQYYKVAVSSKKYKKHKRDKDH